MNEQVIYPGSVYTEDVSSKGMMYNSNVTTNMLQEQLNPDLILELIKNYLLGIKIDDDGNKIVYKDLAYMNEKGANYVYTMLMGVVNNNTVLSNFDDAEAYDLTRYMMFEITIHLGFNNTDYDLELKKLGSVINFIKNMVLITLKRSIDKTTLKALTQVERIQLNQVQGPPKERRSLFNFKKNY